MKISSASKKVLASALSAAMVVAFAPTVAFAAKTNTASTMTVTYDLNGGSLSNSNDPLTGEIIQVQKGDGQDNDTLDHLFVTTTKGTSNMGKVVGPNGYDFAGWFVDADNNGVKSSNEAAIAKVTSGQQSTADGTIDLSQYKISGDAITLKAYYSNPAISEVTFTQGSNADSRGTIAVTLPEGVANHKYTLKVTLPDGSTCEQGFGGTGEPAVNAMNESGNTTVTFKDNPTSSNRMEAYASKMVAGDYTVTLSEGDKVLSSESFKLVAITVKDGVNTPAGDDVTYLSELGADGKVQVTLPANSGYLYEDGTAVIDEDDNTDGVQVTVKGDTVVKTTSAVQAAAGFTYDTNARTANVDVVDSTAAAGDTYAVSVADPSGAEVYTATVKADASNLNANVAFGFDPAFNGGRASEEETAGTYVATVTKTVKATGAVTTSKVRITLSQVAYDLGEAKAKADAKTSYFTSDDEITSATFASLSDAAPKGQSFDKWTVNGKSYEASKTVKLETGKVNTVTAVYKATNAASTPGVSVSKVVVGTTPTYYVTVTGTAAGETVKTGQGATASTAYNGPFSFDASETYLEVKVEATGKDANTVKFANVIGAAKAWGQATSGASNVFETTIGKVQTKWLAADGVKAAIESGKASCEELAAKYLVEQETVDAADLAAYKALYEAVEAEANAQLKAYENSANVIGGKKVYYMTSGQYAAAAKAIADKESVAALAVKNATTDADKASAYKAQANNLISAANTALNGVTENTKVAVADVTAAQEVTASLQAAKTANEAKAALESYSKLSDAAKSLVATADVAAAQKIVSDAEAKAALVNAQDLAAARDLNGKKVTAKAKVGKKAQGKSFAYKLAASESGATASYAKVSGSKYIKISKSGKVTFSKVKVAKKAKTYKAKVSVTYGTQTVTKTVQLVVKKK